MDKKVVVLIDSGINKLDFCDCLVGGKHFYVEENYVCCDDSFDDDNGHGSACAYTIKSIFPETQFYIIKILDQNLETVYPVLEAALEHCMDLKYHIINLSLSLLEEVGSVNLKLICDALQKKGKIIVASVSNGHRQSFPAAYPSVIGVRGSFFSSSDPSYLIRPARSTPKNKAGGGAARKGSASAVFMLILPAKNPLPKVLPLFYQTTRSDSPCGHRVHGRP